MMKAICIATLLAFGLTAVPAASAWVWMGPGVDCHTDGISVTINDGGVSADTDGTVTCEKYFVARVPV